MKKRIKLVLVVLLAGVSSYMIYVIVTKTRFKNEIVETLRAIPDFSFKKEDGSFFTRLQLKENIPTIFIYFSTECDFCHHEARSIKQHLLEFKDVEVLFVSIEDLETIHAFADKYHLSDQPNIHFLYDSSHIFSHRFAAQSVPYILIYNSQQELIKKHKGQINVKTILEVLQ